MMKLLFCLIPAVATLVAVSLFASCSNTCARSCAGVGACAPPSGVAHLFTPQGTDVIGDFPYQVYAIGNREQPPVLLMHDIAGPRPECVKLAKRISDEGYCVYVPVFYGAFDKNSDVSFISSFFFSRKGWNFHTADADQPCLSDVEKLCAHLRVWHHDHRVMVMGNCATGGLAVALLSSPDVSAAITSQPALPYAILFAGYDTQRALDMSPETLRAAINHAVTLLQPALLGLHFYRDYVSREPRFERIKAEFGDSFRGVQIAEGCDKVPATFITIPTTNSRQHSVLIPSEGQAPGEHDAAAFTQLKAFLHDHAR